MAIITLKELLDAIESHPKYKGEWEKGVPASQSLYIQLGEAKDVNLSSNVLQGVESSEIALDKDINGYIHAIEIM